MRGLKNICSIFQQAEPGFSLGRVQVAIVNYSVWEWDEWLNHLDAFVSKFIAAMILSGLCIWLNWTCDMYDRDSANLMNLDFLVIF